MPETTTFSFDEIAPEAGGFAKFDEPGTTVRGIIRNPRWLPNNFADQGGPAKHFAVDLDDNGTVTVLKFDKRGLRDSVKEAGLRVGVNGIKEGDHLEVTYVGEGDAVREGLSRPKLFAAVYEPADTAWTGA